MQASNQQFYNQQQPVQGIPQQYNQQQQVQHSSVIRTQNPPPQQNNARPQSRSMINPKKLKGYEKQEVQFNYKQKKRKAPNIVPSNQPQQQPPQQSFQQQPQQFQQQPQQFQQQPQSNFQQQT
eukprot:UN00272